MIPPNFKHYIDSSSCIYFFHSCRYDACFVENQNQMVYNDSSMGKTKDFNRLFDSSDFYCCLAENNSPFAPIIQMPESNGECMQRIFSHENGVSAKPYALNPFSEPFQPMQNSHSNTSSPTSLSSDSSPQSSSSIELSAYSSESMYSFGPCENWNESPPKFVCILCPEKYTTLDDLEVHYANHVYQRHVCIVCGSTFAYNYLLQRHLKTHRTVKSVRCRGCAKKFRSFNQLRKHFDFCHYKLHMLI